MSPCVFSTETGLADSFRLAYAFTVVGSLKLRQRRSSAKPRPDGARRSILLKEKLFIVELVCSEEMSAALNAAAREIRLCASRMFKEKLDDYSVLGKPVHEKIAKVFEMARLELGVTSGLVALLTSQFTALFSSDESIVVAFGDVIGWGIYDNEDC
jgi:hypothetical protein